MKIVRKAHAIKIQLSKAQEKKLRKELNCQDRPIQYAGAIMFSQCGGWYEISPCRSEYDWASDEQLMKGMLRRIHSILAPQTSKVESARAYVAVETLDEAKHIINHPAKVVPIDTKASEHSKVKAKVADAGRLALLAQVVNRRYGH